MSRVSSGVTAISLYALSWCSRERQNAGPHTKTTTQPAGVRDLEKKIPQIMTQLRVPGAQIAIVSEGRIGWRQSFGVKDQLSGTPVDDETIFEVQSMSKPVFAYRVLKLADRAFWIWMLR